MMGNIRSRLVDGEGDGSGPPHIGSPNGPGFQRAASGPPGNWRGAGGWRGGSDTGEGPMPRGGLRPMHVSRLFSLLEAPCCWHALASCGVHDCCPVEAQV